MSNCYVLNTFLGARETIVNETNERKVALVEVTFKSGEPNNKTNVSDGGKIYREKIIQEVQ